MSLLISVEGLDGTGKSTLVKEIVALMHSDSAFAGWVYASKEPGSPWPGTAPADLRKMVLETPDFRPLERELLFYVDASLHSRFIENQGEAIVVSDRGLWSHLAYLRGYLKTKQIDWDDYSLCKSLIDRVCHEPDCIVYLKGDLDLMTERLAGKAKDVIEANDNTFFASVLETYEDLVTDREWTGKAMLSLDARASVDINANAVLNYLKDVFDPRQLKNGNRELCFS